jgi:hypothetical protein
MGGTWALDDVNAKQSVTYTGLWRPTAATGVSFGFEHASGPRFPIDPSFHFVTSPIGGLPATGTIDAMQLV